MTDYAKLDLENLLVLATAGDNEAQYWVGNHYYKPRDKSRSDLERASYWYDQAARAGNAKAKNNVAVAGYYRYTMPHADCKQLFLEAAADGVVLAMLNIGMMHDEAAYQAEKYEDVECATEECAKAVPWLLKAAGNGSHPGLRNLFKMCMRLVTSQSPAITSVAQAMGLPEIVSEAEHRNVIPINPNNQKWIDAAQDCVAALKVDYKAAVVKTFRLCGQSQQDAGEDMSLIAETLGLLPVRPPAERLVYNHHKEYDLGVLHLGKRYS